MTAWWGNALDFLIEGTLLQMNKYNGNPIGLQLPMFVELKVVEAGAGGQGRLVERRRDEDGEARDGAGDSGFRRLSRKARR